MTKLTQKQENFSRVYVETGNASEAYRRAYDVGENTKPETVWRKACEVLANGKVAARVAEIQLKAQERTLVTVESLTEEYEEARAMGKTEGQSAAMSTATTGKAKLHGLLVDKSETKVEVKHDFVGAAEAFANVLTTRSSRK